MEMEMEILDRIAADSKSSREYKKLQRWCFDISLKPKSWFVLNYLSIYLSA
jgi:hypothetical protein